MLVSSMGPASSPCSPLRREQSSVVSVFACFASLFSLLFVHVCLHVCGRAEGGAGVFLSCSPPYFWCSTSHWAWLSSVFCGVSISCVSFCLPSSVGTAGAHWCASFCRVCAGDSADPPACAAVTSPRVIVSAAWLGLRDSLCSFPGWPWTQVFLLLPPKCWNYKSVSPGSV